MKPDTPLDEVARHLPAEAAAHLSEFEWPVQESVLQQVRAMVVFWETKRYVFDPVAYEGILIAVVSVLSGLLLAGQQLSQRLLIADAQLNTLLDRIEQLTPSEEQP